MTIRFCCNHFSVPLLFDGFLLSADGGTNRLFDLSTEAERAAGLLLPDFIKGDLDSIRRTDVLPHYA
jgi:thiamine pyrophosphokinase